MTNPWGLRLLRRAVIRGVWVRVCACVSRGLYEGEGLTRAVIRPALRPEG